MNHPYRSSSTKLDPKLILYKYRVIGTNPIIKPYDNIETISYHRYFWLAWLYAWWYCFKHPCGEATIQINKSKPHDFKSISSAMQMVRMRCEGCGTECIDMELPPEFPVDCNEVKQNKKSINSKLII
jgi:hypothetical protein